MTEKEQQIFEKLLDAKFAHQNDKFTDLDNRLDVLENKVDVLQGFKIKVLSMGSVTTFFGSIIAFIIGTAIDFLKLK